MPDIKFNCPKCNGEFTVDSSLVGRLAECSQCKTRIRIPYSNVSTEQPTIVLSSSKPQTNEPIEPQFSNYSLGNTKAIKMKQTNMAKKGTSNVPMIMGIIGGVLGVPAAFCSGACAACIGAFSDASKGTTNQTSELGNFYLWMGIIGAIAGLIGGILGKKFPVPAGVIMLLATFKSGITLIAGNLLALIVAILFLLGGAFCFTQKKEDVA